MIFVLIAAFATAAVLAVVLSPLLTEARPARNRARSDFAIYRGRIEEIERDAARGLVEPGAADAARLEIEYRILASGFASDAPEPSPPRPLLPSRPSGPEPATLSPLAARGRDRFKRGLLVHRLLQALPELPAAERAGAARRFLALPVHGLAAAEQDEIRDETLAVLDDPAFAALWGPEAQAEVSVVGLIPGASPGAEHALSGQIDRLVVTPERVLIVDFKTVRPAPASEAQVPPLYLQQLATYRAAIARIYPGRRVDGALLWTDGPRLMLISGALLDRHLPGRLQR